MATKQKEVTTFDVQVAEFIRNHKKTGTATDDEINNALVIPFTLDVYLNYGQRRKSKCACFEH